MTHYIEVAVSREINPDLLSRLLMRFMKVRYSHIFIIYKNEVIHSTGKGVHGMPLYEFMDSSGGHELPIVKKINLKCDPEFFKGFIYGCMGKEYSESQYIGFLFPFLRPFFKNGTKRTICSEFVANVLNNCCGYDLKNIDFISPKGLIEQL